MTDERHDDPQAERAYEQERIDRITAVIRERIRLAERQAGELTKTVVEIRKHFWDDVTVNFDELDDVLETQASLKQQAEVLAERERSQQLSERQIRRLVRMEPSPYFGRIDFREDGEAAPEQVYIGIATLMNDASDEFLIYDWRAPICSVYYDHIPGPADYETPLDHIRGELTLKRQFLIRDGQIHSMFDTGVTIGDELLQVVLGRQSDAQMKSIVATIQREQNLVIRNDRTRLLIVQGAAGSGKTSAALQRIAYLLYKHRNTVKADQIVLFSPNPMFNSYIAHVLPELGEENMEQATFQEYLEYRLAKRFRLEHPYEQMEKMLKGREMPDYQARKAAIAFKSSVSYLEALRRYAEELNHGGMVFRNLVFRREVILPKQRLSEEFYRLPATLSLHDKVRELAKWLLQVLDRVEEAERHKAWVDEEIEGLDPEEYQKAYQKLRQRGRKAPSHIAYEKERDYLARKVVQDHFRPLRAKIKALRFIHATALYRRLFQEPQLIERLLPDEALPELWKEICALTLQALNDRTLLYEDATPYLYLKEQIEGFQTDNTVRYVLIDEAQDYTPFQFEFVKRLFPRARMTVLGDFNQAIFPHTEEDHGFEPLTKLYGERESELIRLTKSYRSTRQIVEFSRGLAVDGARIEPFQREGASPVVMIRENGRQLGETVAESVRRLREQGHESIAVICRTAAESEHAQTVMSGQHGLDIRLITRTSHEFEKGLSVIPAYLAKGVEFDAVVIYNASAYDPDRDRRLLYTACTRAMHELVVCCEQAMPELLASLDPETYRLHHDTRV